MSFFISFDENCWHTTPTRSTPQYAPERTTDFFANTPVNDAFCDRQWSMPQPLDAYASAPKYTPPTFGQTSALGKTTLSFDTCVTPKKARKSPEKTIATPVTPTRRLDTLPVEVQDKIQEMVHLEAKRAAVKRRIREQRVCKRNCRSLIRKRGYCCENFNLVNYL
jgi:hypothetical protein